MAQAPVNRSNDLTLSIQQEVQDQQQERSPTHGSVVHAMTEQKMNWFVLLEMFFQSASSSIGTVGFVWATVVLLGGFVSKLNKIEFWFVTVLSFIQAMRVFGGDWNSDQMILYGILLPQRTSAGARTGARTLPLHIRIFINVMIFMDMPISLCCTPNWDVLLVCGKLLLLFAAITIRFLRLMALLGCVALFATHVTLQRLGQSTGNAEDSNMRASLNMFYGLAVAQALLSYMVVVFASSREKLVTELRECRGLSGLDDDLLGLYYSHVRATCRNRGARFALHSTLIRFALESITSATHSVRQDGVETLHVLMESSTSTGGNGGDDGRRRSYSYAEKAALKLRDCPEAMESLFWMAALASPDERPKRARAACILARVAGTRLRVSGVPSAIPSVCSLLEDDVHSSSYSYTSVVDPVSVQTDLVAKGLEILERLSRNADNLAEICNSDHLMSIITKFIIGCSRRGHDKDSHHLKLQKASTSLLILSRLAGATGSQRAMLRQVMLRNLLLMSGLRAILWTTPETNLKLRIATVRTVACFSLDGESRDCEASRKMVIPLLDIFCSEGQEQELIQQEAGKALEMLTAHSKHNSAAVLEADDDYFQALCTMLLDRNHQGTCGVARIFSNLCACLDPGPSYTNLKDFVEENIAEVLRRTSVAQQDAPEELEAFLGLGLEFAKWTSPQVFAEALDKIGSEAYTKMLVTTAWKENHQCPGALRYAIEQVIWMAKHEREVHCVALFRDNGMEAALRQVQGVAAEIQDYKLLSPIGPVLEHQQPLPSLVKTALKLIRNSHIAREPCED